MKKKLAVLLAATMLMGALPLSATAYEAEASMVGNYGGYTLVQDETTPAVAEDLYEQTGPWGQWTEAQKAAAESWTEDQWDAYWSQYSMAMDTLQEQCWVDEENWRNEYYGPVEEVEDYRTQTKREMGMPFPSGVNVSLNGVYLDFGGIAPMGDIYDAMVPFRAFLEGLGGKVAYQNGAFTAAMPDGLSITAKPGSTDLTYTVGDKINTLQMYSAPVVEKGVTYIEVGPLAEALGLQVSFTTYYDVVHLTDWEALAEELDGHFTVYNTLLAAERKSIEPDQTYAVHLGGSFSGTLYGERKSDTATFTCSADGVVNAKAAEGSVQIKLDQGGMKDTVFAGIISTAGLDEESGNAVKGALDMLSNLKVDLRADLAAGKTYFRSNSLSKVPGYPAPDNVWLEVDGGGQGMGAAGIVMEKSTLTVTGLLRLFERSFNGGYYSTISPAQWTRQMAGAMEKMIGDDRFTISKSGDVTTYTVKVGIDQFLAGIASGAEADESIFNGAKNVVTKLDMTFTARLKGNEYLDDKVDMLLGVGGTNPTTITVKATGTQEGGSLTLGIKGAYVGAMELKLDAGIKETTRVPAAAPAAGEKVERLSDYS